MVAWGRGKETKASVRVTLAKGLDKKRVAGMAAKRLKYGVDTMAQLDVQKSKLRAMTVRTGMVFAFLLFYQPIPIDCFANWPQNEVKALKQHIRYLGYDTETAVAGLGTVKVGQPGVGAQLYKNKVRWVVVGVGHGMGFLSWSQHPNALTAAPPLIMHGTCVCSCARTSSRSCPRRRASPSSTYVRARHAILIHVCEL